MESVTPSTGSDGCPLAGWNVLLTRTRRGTAVEGGDWGRWAERLPNNPKKTTTKALRTPKLRMWSSEFWYSARLHVRARMLSGNWYSNLIPQWRTVTF